MTGRMRRELPADLSQAAARFAQWRRRRELGTRIPEAFWDLARELAARYGVSRTATALKVGYYELKKQLAAQDSPSRDVDAAAPAPAFVELTPSLLAAPSECLVEFEKKTGERMRVHVQGHHLPDLAALSRSFWEVR